MENRAIHKLIEDLRASDLFKEYESAYREVTRLPLIIRSPDDEQKLAHTKGQSHPFCHFMRQYRESCITWLHVKEQNGMEDETLSHTCFAGLHVSAVPVKVRDTVIGYLQTGEVLLETQTEEKLTATTKKLLDWGIRITESDLKSMYEEGRYLSPKQYEAVISMLEIFGQHISALAEKLSFDSAHHEPDNIRRSKEYIRRNIDKDLNLDDVAAVANMSAAHFCRMFKRVTDMNFSEYVNRVRIDRAKELMNTTALTISQIAYETGFNSVTHFNRTFRKFTGMTPTNYRQAELV